MNTVIEYRDKNDGKLKDLIFDEPEFYIKAIIDGLKFDGHTDFAIIDNPKKYNLFPWISQNK